MKKIMPILFFWTGSVLCMCMSFEEYQLWRAKQERESFYSEVPQADTDAGAVKALGFLVRLTNEQMAPKVTFADAYAFHSQHGNRHPEVVSIIERFCGSVIGRAFFMQEENAIPDALEVVKANAYDRSYIIMGRKNRMLDEWEFNAKLDEIAVLIKMGLEVNEMKHIRKIHLPGMDQ